MKNISMMKGLVYSFWHAWAGKANDRAQVQGPDGQVYIKISSANNGNISKSESIFLRRFDASKYPIDYH